MRGLRYQKCSSGDAVRGSAGSGKPVSQRQQAQSRGRLPLITIGSEPGNSSAPGTLDPRSAMEVRPMKVGRIRRIAASESLCS